MPALSDLLGGGGGSAPDAAASLLARVHSTKCWYEYKPVAALQPGKYVVKSSYQGRSTLRVSTDKGDYANSLDDNSAVIDITQPTNNLMIRAEHWNAPSGPEQQFLPRYYPGLTSSTAAGTSIAYGGQQQMACDPSGKVWIQVVGYTGALYRSTDYGRTWLNIGRIDTMVGVASSYYSSYHVTYALGRFIVTAGPNEIGTASLGVSIASTNGYSWTRINTNMTGVISSATNAVDPGVNTDSGVSQFEEGSVAVFARYATSANVLYSTDGYNFVALSPTGFTGNAWFAEYFPTYNGGTFVVADDANHLLVSTNGIDWDPVVTIPFSARAITRMDNTFYAIGSNGVVYSSTNLSTWTTLVTLSSTTYKNHCLLNNGSLLVYYDCVNGLVRTSTDGVTWTSRVSVSAHGSLNYVNGRFWVFDQSNAYMSDDGLYWDYRYAASAGQTIRGAAFGAGLWVTGGGTSITTSPDAVVWTGRTNPTTGNIYDIKWNGTCFIMVTDGGKIARSTDGITWTQTATGLVALYGVNYDPDDPTVWVAVGNSATVVYRSADDGLTWTSRTISPTNVQVLNMVKGIGGGKWWAVGNAGTMAVSTDNGLTWSPMPASNWRTFWGGRGVAPTLAWYSIAYGNGTLVAVGDRSVAYSKDQGQTWYFRDNNSYIFYSVIQDVKFRGDKFIAVGRNGAAWYSLDGIEWLTMQSGFNTSDIYTFAYNSVDSVYLLAGVSGITRISRDETNFTTPAMTFAPSTSYAATYGSGGHYLVTGNNGIWITDNFDVYDEPVTNTVGGGYSVTQVVYGNGRYVGVAATTGATYYSPNGRNWGACRSSDGVTDVRANNVIFADGRFWKMYASKLAVSLDGITWTDYHEWPVQDTYSTGTLGFPPTYIKKSGGYYFAFGRNSGANGRYFWFSRDLVERPDSWTIGDTGQTGAGFYITDIAVNDEMAVFCYNSGSAAVSPSITASAGATNASNLVYSQNWGAIPMWNAFTVGGKMFGVDTANNLYQITRESDQYNSTTSQYGLMARAWYAGVWGTYGYMTLPEGNGAVAARADRAYRIEANQPTTFSIYNSNVATVDGGLSVGTSVFIN